MHPDVGVPVSRIAPACVRTAAGDYALSGAHSTAPDHLHSVGRGVRMVFCPPTGICALGCCAHAITLP